MRGLTRTVLPSNFFFLKLLPKVEYSQMQVTNANATVNSSFNQVAANLKSNAVITRGGMTNIVSKDTDSKIIVTGKFEDILETY